MTTALKNKMIKKLNALGVDVSKIIDELNNGDLQKAADEADRLQVDFIGIKIEALIETK